MMLEFEKRLLNNIINFMDMESEALAAGQISLHHRWYNNLNSYRESVECAGQKSRSVINLTAVADSIGAATDIVSRSYSNILTLEQVIDEIHQGAGTRYGPKISEALQDLGLREKVFTCITTCRKNAHYKAYQHVIGNISSKWVL